MNIYCRAGGTAPADAPEICTIQDVFGADNCCHCGWPVWFGWVVIRPGRRGQCRPPYGRITKTKNPRSHVGSRDESMIRGTTLFISGGDPSGSSKPYPGNGGNRVPLLRPRPFTGPTQEPDLRAQSTGSHRPPALWSMETGRIFPSMSFRCIQLTLKHKQTGLSTSLR